MGFSHQTEDLLKVGSGIFWSLTYLLIIWRGFKDRTFGMPIIALCANISWEFIFSFIYPAGGVQRYVNIAWFVLDLLIVFQTLRYGPGTFGSLLSGGWFYLFFLLSLAISFMLVLGVTVEFQNWNGMYAAFGQNLMMSAMFLVMLYRRGNLAGQSLYIAIFKMIGTVLPSMLFYARNPDSILMNSLYISIFIFDVIYIVLLYAKYKELNLQPQPWCRV